MRTIPLKCRVFFPATLIPRLLLLFCFICSTTAILAQQTPEEKLQKLDKDLEAIKAKEIQIHQQIETIKLDILRNDLTEVGIPAFNEDEKVIHHSAMSLVYNERHEQAKWVAHIIRPEIITSNMPRTDDFRTDPKVTTGTAVEADYFLKNYAEDSTIVYDGFGFDRGHLAPSADFRWSEKAMSESYFYSNMSPQLDVFNRGKWSELESLMRAYIFSYPNTQLYVVTGPVLEEYLPKIERSINDVSIPEMFFKVAIDLKNKRAIGFVMPNQELNIPINRFVKTIDEVEKITGIDFFPKLDDKIENELESQNLPNEWLPKQKEGDVDPIYPPSLPSYHFNSKQAKIYLNSSKKINVCGTVVSARASRKGNIILNLDKQFPNQLFTIFIKKENINNFDMDLEKDLLGKKICVKGQVSQFSGSPAMFIQKNKDLKFLEE